MMDFYSFGLSLDPHAVQQRHVLYDDSDEEDDTETSPLDPQFKISPKVSNKIICKFLFSNPAVEFV